MLLKMWYVSLASICILFFFRQCLLLVVFSNFVPQSIKLGLAYIKLSVRLFIMIMLLSFGPVHISTAYARFSEEQKR